MPELRGPPSRSEDDLRNTNNVMWVSATRFPNWLFCQSCKKLSPWRKVQQAEIEETLSYQWGTDPILEKGVICPNGSCRSFENVMTPMRFIQICQNGHMQDVNWSFFVHGTGGTCQSVRLKFNSNDRNTSLASLFISCDVCKKTRTLAGITTDMNRNCPGFEVGSNRNDSGCEETMHVVPRSSGLVWKPLLVTALDIPTSDAAAVDIVDWMRRNINEINELGTLKKYTYMFDHDEFMQTAIPAIQNKFNEENPGNSSLVTKDNIKESFEPDHNDQGYEYDINLLKPDEWQIFLRDEPSRDVSKNFHLDPIKVKNEEGHSISFIEKIIRVESIREVRALKGYSRYKDPTHDSYCSVWGNDREDWLPAIEAYGEGIFLKFNEKNLSQWEKNSESIERIKPIEEASADSNRASEFPITPRSILLHTFSHLFMKALTFVSGYSGPSIRERIYVTDNRNSSSNMAGILIYTTDSDSQGTLGGLQEQANIEKVNTIVKKLIISGSWCSFDPVCTENIYHVENSLSLASCSACAFIAETSCELFNQFLDRKLLFDEKFGFLNNEYLKLYS